MKKITTLFILALSIQSYAIDRFVNPNLSSGNGTTLFTNITSAITAAVNGDRIIVASNTYNEAALTIGKSLQIMPQTPGTTINFNANITIAGFPGMKLEITGFNLGIYSFSSSSISGGSVNNRAKISIINCSSELLMFNNDFYETNFIENIISSGIVFRYGNIIKNITKQISLLDEPDENLATNNKILIIANQVEYLIGVYNNSYPVIIANNSMRDLSFRRWHYNINYKNYIINNEFIQDNITNQNSTINISFHEVPGYNIIFSSNKFNNGFVSYTHNNTVWSLPNVVKYIGSSSEVISSPLNYNFWLPGSTSWYMGNSMQRPPTNLFNTGWSDNGSTNVPNLSTIGFFEFSYNGLLGNFSVPSSGSPISLTNIVGQIEPINGGNPNHAFYDIDLTINDRGINGGPFSQLNYNATNTNNSKAFIFDLDMPADLFPGQNVEIKAKGYHKN